MHREKKQSRIVEAGYQGYRAAQDCSNAARYGMIAEFAPHTSGYAAYLGVVEAIQAVRVERI